MPLVKEAKLAKTFVCLHSRLACFQRSNVRNYAARFGVSATHFCDAAKNFLTQEMAKNMLSNSVFFMLKFHVSVVFFDGKIRSNLPFLKRAEIVFLFAANTVTFKQLI